MDLMAIFIDVNCIKLRLLSHTESRDCNTAFIHTTNPNAYPQKEDRCIQTTHCAFNS